MIFTSLLTLALMQALSPAKCRYNMQTLAESPDLIGTIILTYGDLIKVISETELRQLLLNPLRLLSEVAKNNLSNNSDCLIAPNSTSNFDRS